MVKKLDELVGETINALVPQFSASEWQKLKLLAVESAGIWVENKKVMDQLLESFGATDLPPFSVPIIMRVPG